ncbi:MAG: hypothetical protein WBF89_12375 [Steroidobacteraceae bacterium]
MQLGAKNEIKILSLFIDVDRMMGKHFEDGLRDLGTAGEAAAIKGGCRPLSP